MIAIAVLISGIGTTALPVSQPNWGDVASRLMPDRSLRLVVLRKPIPFMPSAKNPQYLLAYCTETFECGHKVDFFPYADLLIAKRRNCAECAANSQKKPNQSVGASTKRKRA